MTEPAQGSRINLIQSDEQEPLVRMVPGKRFEVAVVPVVDRDLSAVRDETVASEGIRPARLCGSRETCLAIVEID